MKSSGVRTLACFAKQYWRYPMSIAVSIEHDAYISTNDSPSAAIIYRTTPNQRKLGRDTHSLAREGAYKITIRTLTSGSCFITFFILASGRGGWRQSGVSCSAASTCRCQNERRNSCRGSPDWTYGGDMGLVAGGSGGSLDW